jgi:hypothetical protein
MDHATDTMFLSPLLRLINKIASKLSPYAKKTVSLLTQHERKLKQ